MHSEAFDRFSVLHYQSCVGLGAFVCRFHILSYTTIEIETFTSLRASTNCSYCSGVYQGLLYLHCFRPSPATHGGGARLLAYMRRHPPTEPGYRPASSPLHTTKTHHTTSLGDNEDVTFVAMPWLYILTSIMAQANASLSNLQTSEKEIC